MKALDPTFETQGVLLFKNIFKAAPAAIEMFSFKDEPDLYNSPKLKKHGAAVCAYVDKAMDDFKGNAASFVALGQRHHGRGVQIPHYAVVGDALMETFAQAGGEKFTDEIRSTWIILYNMLAGVMQSDLPK